MELVNQTRWDFSTFSCSWENVPTTPTCLMGQNLVISLSQLVMLSISAIDSWCQLFMLSSLAIDSWCQLFMLSISAIESWCQQLFIYIGTIRLNLFCKLRQTFKAWLISKTCNEIQQNFQILNFVLIVLNTVIGLFYIISCSKVLKIQNYCVTLHFS